MFFFELLWSMFVFVCAYLIWMCLLAMARACVCVCTSVCIILCFSLSFDDLYFVSFYRSPSLLCVSSAFRAVYFMFLCLCVKPCSWFRSHMFVHVHVYMLWLLLVLVLLLLCFGVQVLFSCDLIVRFNIPSHHKIAPLCFTRHTDRCGYVHSYVHTHRHHSVRL